ncbi:MAG: DNA polymerase III subunit delta [Candidatus Firestonebacteria bacterium]|nr:DNA polymerase III subunit delta [Candidatus Firestonebacteria bacterium]
MAGKITKPLVPVYFVTGNDEYNKDRKVKEILKKALPVENKELNYTEIECTGKEEEEEEEDEGATAEDQKEEAPVRAKSNFVFDFDSTLNTVPFLADRRVVVLRGFEKLRKDLKDMLLAYIKNPSDQTVLILVSRDVKKAELDKGVTYKKIAASADVSAYYQLYPGQVGAGIKSKFFELGKTITPAAVEILIERVGNNLRDLDSEIEKVMLYIGEKKQIDEIDVEFLVSGLDTKSIFDFVNALAERNLTMSLKIINDIFYSMDKRKAGPMVVGAAYAHFKKIWTAKILIRAGISEQSIASKLGVNPYFIPGILNQARTYEEKQLKAVFMELARTDRETKSSSGKTPLQVIESLVYKLLLK